MYIGSLAFGVTSCDPATVAVSSLPEDADMLLDRWQDIHLYTSLYLTTYISLYLTIPHYISLHLTLSHYTLVSA